QEPVDRANVGNSCHVGIVHDRECKASSIGKRERFHAPVPNHGSTSLTLTATPTGPAGKARTNASEDSVSLHVAAHHPPVGERRRTRQCGGGIPDEQVEVAAEAEETATPQQRAVSPV